MASSSDSSSAETSETLYDILDITPDAVDAVIRRAYKQQALRWHPDKCSEPGAETKFKQIAEAWHVLSDDNRRAVYDEQLRSGVFDDDRSQNERQAAAREAAYQAYQEFMWREEQDAQRRMRRERACLVGVISLVAWVSVLLAILQRHTASLGLPPQLFRPPLVLSTRELARLPLTLEFASFRERLDARHRARARPLAALAWLPDYMPAYLRIDLNQTSELRRAPEVGQPHGRGWLLRSAATGEDIYGRELNLVTSVYVRPPAGQRKTGQKVLGMSPEGMPTLCTQLWRSGSLHREEWYDDMARSVGGRLRPFGLAAVPPADCEPEVGLLAIAASTLLALIATRLTLRMASLG
jgi:curved DNA-binding protein CbpA